MKELFRQAGYWIDLTTWENDGDNTKTESFYVGSHGEKDDVILLARVLRRFGSNGRVRDRNHLGNMDIDSNFKFELDAAVIEIVTEIHPSYKNHINYIFAISELACEMVGVWADGEYIRVVEDVKLYYNEHDIYMKRVDIE